MLTKHIYLRGFKTDAREIRSYCKPAAGLLVSTGYPSDQYLAETRRYFQMAADEGGPEHKY
jgi:hypothetical protein